MGMNAVSLLSVLTLSEKTANALCIGVLSVCQSLSQNYWGFETKAAD